MKFLVCALDDEHYASPYFYICDTLEKAKKISRDLCKEFADYYDEENPEYDEEPMRLDVSLDDDMHRFFVTEIKEVDGNYALVEHHAYDGVDFEVRCCGTDEECEAERNKWISEMQELCETDEVDDTYDTGVEWIHIELVNLSDR